MHRALIPLALAFAAAPSAQAPPGFDVGDVRTLSARVVGADPVAKSVAAAIVRVAVKNGGAAPAEPLGFRFTPAARKDAPEPRTVLRVDGPHYGRAGRPIPPGASVEYDVLVPYEAKVAKAAAVEVESASFPTAVFSLENPVKILATEVVRAVDRDLGRTTKRTRIELANAAPYELDVVMRARFETPMKAESLIEVRLPANASREVVIDELPTERGRGYSEAEIVDLSIVDWCAIVTRGETPARALLGAAWDAWYRLPDDLPGLHGSFTYRFQEGGRAVDAAGAFQLSRDGTVALEPPAGEAIAGALRDAFRDLCRPAASEALDGLAVELFELGGAGRATIVRLDRAPFLGTSGETFLGIVDGRIAWSSGSRAPLPRELWTVQTSEPGAAPTWVATDVEHRTAFQVAPQETRRTRYERVGALLVPVDFRTTWTLEAFPDSAKSTHVALSDVVVGTASAPTPPTGALADALRAAWEAPYRYPEAPRTLVGRFAIETPATDLVWHGQRKVQGAFRLEGFRGRSWDRAVIDVEGRALTDAMRAELANAVEDRFYLFAHRDFAARSPFDRAFAGATLSGDPGRVGVEFAPFSAVEIRDGLPTVLERPAGSRRTLELKKLGKALVPTTIATDAETIRATWTDLGDGWAYPKELVFERVFGPDWGPETIRLSKLAVE